MSPRASRRLIRGWGIAIGIGIWILVQAVYHTWGQEELISLRIFSFTFQPEEIPSPDPDRYWGLQYMKAVQSVKPSQFQDLEKRRVTVGVLYQSSQPFEIELDMETEGSRFTFEPSSGEAGNKGEPTFEVVINREEGMVSFSTTGQLFPLEEGYMYLILTDPAFRTPELRRYPEGNYPEEWPEKLREALPAVKTEGN